MNLRKLNQVADPLFLGLLFAADLAFLALHIANRYLPHGDILLTLSTERGYSEIFQYIKEYWIAVLFLVVCFRKKQGVFLAWAALFVYLLCDDALTIHETAGGLLAAAWNFSPMFGLRPQDFGELLVSLAAGFVFVILLVIFYPRSTPDSRRAAIDLALLLGLLAFFGVAVDLLHVALGGVFPYGWIILEDSGEMIAMSLIAAYAAHLLNEREHVPGALWDALQALPVMWRSRREAG